MARLSEARDTQETKEKKEAQEQKAVLSFFKSVKAFFIGTGYSIHLKTSTFKDFGKLDKDFNGGYFTPARHNEYAHDIFIQMTDDIKVGKSLVTFDDFLPLIKFNKYPEAKIQALIFFCNFFEAILQSKDPKDTLKPISVVKYEHYLKGMEQLEYAFNDNPSILEPLKFKAETKYFLEAKRQKSIFDARHNKQKIKDNFKWNMLELTEMFMIDANDFFEKATLTNKIHKYLYPKDKNTQND